MRLQLYLAVIFVDALTYSMVIPVAPFIVMQMGYAELIGGFFIAVHPLFSAFTGPVLGKFSDRMGRRKILAITLLATAVSYAIFALAANIIVLFGSRILLGALAGNAAIARAGLADESSEERRVKVMSQATATWALGFVLGPSVAAAISYLADNDQFWIGAVASIVVLPLTAYMWTSSSGEQASQLSDLGRTKITAATNASLLSLGAIVAINAFCQTGLVAMTGFWVFDLFGFGSSQTGLLFAWVSIAIVAFQIRALGRQKNPTAIQSSIMLFVILLLILSIITAVWGGLLLVALVFVPLIFCMITGVQSLANALVSIESPQSRRAQDLALLNSAAALGRIAGPLAFGVIYALYGPGSPFLVVAAACVGSALFSLLFRRGHRSPSI